MKDTEGHYLIIKGSILEEDTYTQYKINKIKKNTNSHKGRN